MSKVYVVYHWSDYRDGGNSSKIIGVYKSKETALQIMKLEIEKYVKKYDATVEHVTGEDAANVIYNGGEDYEIFETKETLYFEQ